MVAALYWRDWPLSQFPTHLPLLMIPGTPHPPVQSIIAPDRAVDHTILPSHLLSLLKNNPDAGSTGLSSVRRSVEADTRASIRKQKLLSQMLLES